MPRSVVALEVEVQGGLRRRSSEEGPSSGGPLRKNISALRAERRQSPHDRPTMPPSSLSSLVGHVDDLGIAPVSARTRLKIRNGKVTGGFSKKLHTLPPLAASSDLASSARLDPLAVSSARDASPELMPSARCVKPERPPPTTAPPAPPDGRPPVRMSVAESREVRKARRAKVKAQEEAEHMAAMAAKEAREHAQVVAMLREYEHQEAAPPSPHMQLYLDAEEAAGDPYGCKDLRGRLRSTAASAAKEVPADGNGLSLETFRRKPDGAPRLNASAFALFLKRLSAHQEERPDDAHIANRLFGALDTADAGQISTEQAVRGVFPAFSRVSSVRRRWMWEMMYDPRGKGWLGSTDIFHLLDALPEGCRLEEDVLAIIKAAAACADAGKAARVHKDDYIAGLEECGLTSAASAGVPSEDPDVLGLRRRRRSSDAARLMRARARSLLLARRWVAPTSHAASAHTSSVSSAAVSTGSQS